jgi:putative two-component system response regulator
MTNGSGKHFDADIIEAFIDIQDEFLEIANKFSDDDESNEKKAIYLQRAMANSRGSSTEAVK